MRVLRILTALAALSSLSASAAENNPGAVVAKPIAGVIELFTSQGCLSCPPADELFQSYASRPDVVALSMSIDYWDYIGWKDTLASPRNTERQRGYAQARGDGQVYTPQVVVNGQSHVNGASSVEVESALRKTGEAFRARQIPVRFWHERGSLVIQTGEAPPGANVKEATIWLALVQRAVEVPIARGENKGRTVTYHNVTRELTPVGTWTGSAMTIRLARTALMRPDAETAAVILQYGDTGPIVGAAWMGL